MAWINSMEGKRAVEDAVYQIVSESPTLSKMMGELSTNLDSSYADLAKEFGLDVLFDSDRLAWVCTRYAEAHNKRKRMYKALDVLAKEAVLGGTFNSMY